VKWRARLALGGHARRAAPAACPEGLGKPSLHRWAEAQSVSMLAHGNAAISQAIRSSASRDVPLGAPHPAGAIALTIEPRRLSLARVAALLASERRQTPRPPRLAKPITRPISK
jgi:hypothetical protein